MTTRKRHCRYGGQERKDGMRRLKAVAAAGLAIGVLNGCVWKSAYDDQVDINRHLSAVKTEQDVERDGLHADVNALHRAYSDQSLRLTAVEGLIMHFTAELKSNQGRMASLIQEQGLLRAELVKMSVQATETLNLLRTIAEEQQATSRSVTALSGKVDTLKKTTASRPAKGSPLTDLNDQKADGDGKAEKTKVKEKTKETEERPLEPRASIVPTGEGTKPPHHATSGADESKPAKDLTAQPPSVGAGTATTTTPGGPPINTSAATVPAKGDKAPVTVLDPPSSVRPTPEVQSAIEQPSPLAQKQKEAAPVPATLTFRQKVEKFFGWNQTVQTAQKATSEADKKP